MNNDYVKLGELEVYRLSVGLSDLAWGIFERMDWTIKKVIGDQFIRSFDSIGANIAEGYGRFHHKDKIKFYYNSRGSLLESKHWVLLLWKRNIISKLIFNDLIELLNKLHQKLNSYIKACSKQIYT